MISQVYFIDMSKPENDHFVTINNIDTPAVESFTGFMDS